MYGRMNPMPISFAVGPTVGKTQLDADKTVLVYRAPWDSEVVDAGFAAADTAIAKSATNYAVVQILNAGAAGTGTSVIASVTIGKSASVAAATPAVLAFTSTVANKKLDAGDYVAVKYDENGALTLHDIRGSFSVIFGHED